MGFMKTSDEILVREDLTPMDKLFYSHIIRRSKLKGFCFEDNKNIAKALGVSEKTIEREITKLSELQMIKCENYRKKDQKLYVIDSNSRQVVQDSRQVVQDSRQVVQDSRQVVQDTTQENVENSMVEGTFSTANIQVNRQYNIYENGDLSNSVSDNKRSTINVAGGGWSAKKEALRDKYGNKYQYIINEAILYSKEFNRQGTDQDVVQILNSPKEQEVLARVEKKLSRRANVRIYNGE